MKKIKIHFLIISFLFMLIYSCSSPFYGYSEGSGIDSTLEDSDESQVPESVEQEENAEETSIPESEQESETEPESEPEPAPEPVQETETESGTDPESESDAVVETEPVSEPDPVLEPEPVSETEQVLDTEQVSEPEPVLEPEIIPPSLTFNADLSINDIEIQVEKSNSLYTLTACGDYEKYYWKMGEALLSNEKICSIDCSAFSANSYPLILFAEKDGLLYSSFQYINIENNHSRSILPAFSLDSFQDFVLKIYSLEGEAPALVEEKTFSSLNDLASEKLSLPQGTFTFDLSVSYCGFLFSDSKSLELKNAEEKNLDFNLVLSSFENPLQEVSAEKGNVDIVNYFVSDINVSNASVSLYKEVDGIFELCDYRSSSEGNLPFYRGKNEYQDKKYIRYREELEPGIYWFRLDALSEDGKKAAYLVEMLYITSGALSTKKLETASFFDLYTISYSLNGGFFTGSGPGSSLTEKASSFDSFSLPAAGEMKKPGYSFEGWYYDPAFNSQAPYTFQPGLLSSDLTLYARWTPLSESLSSPEESAASDLSSATPDSTSTPQDTTPATIASTNLTLEESASEIILSINNAEPDDIFLLVLYNSAGNICRFSYEEITFSEGSCRMKLNFKCRKGDSFLISLKAYKNRALISGESIQELKYCEKCLLQTEFSHF